MNYLDDNQKMVRLLEHAASRSYLSEPVPAWSNSEKTEQRVTFTSEERVQIKAFMARYVSVLRQIDYPMTSFFGEENRRTASLLEMISSMLSGSSPEYVAANATRLERSTISHNQAYEIVDLNCLL